MPSSFSDVTPLRGVVLGSATQKLAVAVNVQPVRGKNTIGE